MSSTGSVARSCDDAGFATPQFLLAVGVSLVLLSTFANVLVQQYALAAVQAALDEGARAGSPTDADAGHCLRRAHEAVEGLLGGAYGAGVRLACSHDGRRVSAVATVHFPGWAPLVPDLVRELRAHQVAEP